MLAYEDVFVFYSGSVLVGAPFFNLNWNQIAKSIDLIVPPINSGILKQEMWHLFKMQASNSKFLWKMACKSCVCFLLWFLRLYYFGATPWDAHLSFRNWEVVPITENAYCALAVRSTTKQKKHQVFCTSCRMILLYTTYCTNPVLCEMFLG